MLSICSSIHSLNKKQEDESTRDLFMNLSDFDVANEKEPLETNRSLAPKKGVNESSFECHDDDNVDDCIESKNQQ